MLTYYIHGEFDGKRRIKTEDGQWLLLDKKSLEQFDKEHKRLSTNEFLERNPTGMPLKAANDNSAVIRAIGDLGGKIDKLVDVLSASLKAAK